MPTKQDYSAIICEPPLWLKAGRSLSPPPRVNHHSSLASRTPKNKTRAPNCFHGPLKKIKTERSTCPPTGRQWLPWNHRNGESSCLSLKTTAELSGVDLVLLAVHRSDQHHGHANDLLHIKGTQSPSVVNRSAANLWVSGPRHLYYIQSLVSPLLFVGGQSASETIIGNQGNCSHNSLTGS